MTDFLRRYKRHIIVLHVLVALALLLAFALGAFSSSAVRNYVKAEVRTHGGGTVALQVPKAAVAAVATIAPEQGMKTQTPARAPQAALAAARAQQAAFAAHDQLPPTAPDAAPFQRGCSTRIVQNYSSRNGVTPKVEALHYTVSANRLGPSDVNAVMVWFNNAIAQASSNYIIDWEGYCDYVVPETAKAWAQAAYNSVAVSYEIINTGYDSTYIAPPGQAKLAMVMSDSMCRWSIPIRLGAVDNGRVARTGIVDHGMLGLVGGGHHDIAPLVQGHFDVTVERARVLAMIAAVKVARAKYGCTNGRPGKPKAVPTRAQRRAVLRGQLLHLRSAGESWTQIKATATYRQFVSLGGH